MEALAQWLQEHSIATAASLADQGHGVLNWSPFFPSDQFHGLVCGPVVQELDQYCSDPGAAPVSVPEDLERDTTAKSSLA